MLKACRYFLLNMILRGRVRSTSGGPVIFLQNYLDVLRLNRPIDKIVPIWYIILAERQKTKVRLKK